MENKKNSKGLVITLVIFMLAFAACAILLFTGVVKSPMVKEKDCTETKCNTKTDDDTKKEESKVEDTSMKEGYVKYGEDYKIYGIDKYVDVNGIIVGYQDSLYYIDAGFEDINKISSTTFDENGDYKSEYGLIRMHKYNGKESDLAKVVFSISIESTDGSGYPILIYKDGTVETKYAFTANVLKDYKIKDFVEEKCVERPSPQTYPGACLKAEYKVILIDGTEKTIEKTVE